MPKFSKMGTQEQQHNSSILTKVDKLREHIGTKVALPQLVVVGDQSSGKSSVLEGLTGFGFPRAAELCTRYATQITCRREKEESIHVSIIPHADSAPDEQERVKKFHWKLKSMCPKNLAQLFTYVNEAMGIRSTTNGTSSDGTTLPAFSEHILKIEKLGPNEEHSTVIDVPGIFRQETEGITTDADISLVRNMVESYMKDNRTIILAIIPSNVDPATQEILKLAKKVDPSMTRTMAVLTKPDLAIESTTQQIAIDHVRGKRSDLTLGYYIVKNRGPDKADMTLEEGQAEEKTFFSQAPWSLLAHTGKAGIHALRTRVRELLADLIKKEFPKLKAEVAKELSALRAERDGMGPSRSDPHTQRAFLSKMAEAFQTLARDAVNAYYTSNEMFSERPDLRLITRVVDASEVFSADMLRRGHMRPFATDSENDNEPETREPEPCSFEHEEDSKVDNYLELDEVFDPAATIMPGLVGHQDIMEYIAEVYRSNRGQQLGTFSDGLLLTMFKEQSRKWEPIALSYMRTTVVTVHHFIAEIIKQVCPDPRVRDELWDGLLLEELQGSYRRVMDHTKLLLSIEREEVPLTLNRLFNENLRKSQSGRLLATMKNHGQERDVTSQDNSTERGVFLNSAQLNDFLVFVNKANSEHVIQFMHDILKSYYKVSRDRIIDVVYQQAVNHCLLASKDSPLKIFSTQMVLNLNEDQLDMVAAEDAPVKLRREKLGRDIESFEAALKVLRGSS
ncbi:P-loop containing nucleoside triphosphate hydrolase protein [Xylariaceae sp. FL0662B]|nr:P-loop containing nucleoside triphosphate hydrolase protein [Xylariaceae sp. FL0662B]